MGSNAPAIVALARSFVYLPFAFFWLSGLVTTSAAGTARRERRTAGHPARPAHFPRAPDKRIGDRMASLGAFKFRLWSEEGNSASGRMTA